MSDITWVPAEGELVQVVKNLAGAIVNKRSLVAGDIVKVICIEGKFVVIESPGNSCTGYAGVYENAQVLFLTEVRTVRCVCDNRALFDFGCCCGFLEKERARAAQNV